MNPNLWAAWFSDIPMPAGCTYEQFVAARAQLWAQEDIQNDLDLIVEWTELMTRYPDELALIKQLLRAKSAALRRLSNAGL